MGKTAEAVHQVLKKSLATYAASARTDRGSCLIARLKKDFHF